MRICIITDDNSGFTKKEAIENDVKILRMPIIVDGECYFENETLSGEQFYKFLEEDKDIKTSQPSPGEVINMWEDALKEYDQVVHIPMSSGLSESCHSAQLLSEEFNGKVFVVDNHRISVTLKASVYDAIKLRNEGKTGEEIKRYLEETKSDSNIFIMVDTLKYLKKGGRVTPAGAALGATFHIKPVLSIEGGKLDAFAKCVGIKKSKTTMLNAIQSIIDTKYNGSLDGLEIALVYSYDIESAKLWKKEVEEKFNLKNIRLEPLSLSVATHIGPGALAITVTKIY